MKVALELQPCCGNRSGIGTYTYELARRVHNQKDVEFSGNLFNFLERNDNTQVLEQLGIPIHTCRAFPYGVYRRIWNVLPLSYQQLFPQPVDLTVFFNFIVPPRVQGNVMTTVYDMTYARFPETMDRKNLKRFEQGFSYSVQRSDHILTISEFSKREIVELLHVPEERISVVHCAPHFSDSLESFQTVSETYRLRKPYLLYVGTIEPRKNLTRLIQAYQMLKQEKQIPHQLVLAGGKGWANEEIIRAAAPLQESGDLVMTGFISEAEKNALYANADAFVFPSLYEGFGIPPLEAMNLNCPVICSNAASLPEVVGDAARLVDPMSAEDLADGIWQVLSDRKYAADLIQRGKQQIQKFSWDQSAQKFMDVCKGVLEQT